ncbi:hypothetical protein Pfo_023517 [Paulownia fortunei]|nr:hypothetical protein Pfo_023517 [Paulownia fortunei]
MQFLVGSSYSTSFTFSLLHNKRILQKYFSSLAACSLCSTTPPLCPQSSTSIQPFFPSSYSDLLVSPNHLVVPCLENYSFSSLRPRPLDLHLLSKDLIFLYLPNSFQPFQWGFHQADCSGLNQGLGQPLCWILKSPELPLPNVLWSFMLLINF